MAEANEEGVYYLIGAIALSVLLVGFTILNADVPEPRSPGAEATALDPFLATLASFQADDDCTEEHAMLDHLETFAHQDTFTWTATDPIRISYDDGRSSWEAWLPC